MWIQSPTADSCCCHSTDKVSSQCQCQPELCSCAPDEDDHGLVLLTLPVAALLPGTRAPQPEPRLTASSPAFYSAPLLGAGRTPGIQPRAPPQILPSKPVA